MFLLPKYCLYLNILFDQMSSCCSALHIISSSIRLQLLRYPWSLRLYGSTSFFYGFFSGIAPSSVALDHFQLGRNRFNICVSIAYWISLNSFIGYLIRVHVWAELHTSNSRNYKHMGIFLFSRYYFFDEEFIEYAHIFHISCLPRPL